MTVKNRPAAALGVTMLLMGAAIIFSASRIQSGFSYDVVGPSVFPIIIGTGFLVSAGLILLESIKFDAPQSDEGPINFWPVAVISAALLLEALLIKTLGWLPMAALVFIAGAWAFGDRRLPLNLSLGLGLASVILIAFNWGLGLDLPLGFLAPLLPTN